MGAVRGSAYCGGGCSLQFFTSSRSTERGCDTSISGSGSARRLAARQRQHDRRLRLQRHHGPCRPVTGSSLSTVRASDTASGRAAARGGPSSRRTCCCAHWRISEVERPIVVGHSWGALVALAMALESPEDVAGLVLMSGYYYPMPRAEHRRPARLRSARILRHRLPFVAPHGPRDDAARLRALHGSREVQEDLSDAARHAGCRKCRPSMRKRRCCSTPPRRSPGSIGS